MSTPQSQMDDSKAESRPTNLRQRQQGVSTEISEEFRGPENQGENSLTTRNDPSGPSNFTNDSNLDNVPSMSNQMENTDYLRASYSSRGGSSTEDVSRDLSKPKKFFCCLAYQGWMILLQIVFCLLLLCVLSLYDTSVWAGAAVFSFGFGLIVVGPMVVSYCLFQSPMIGVLREWVSVYFSRHVVKLILQNIPFVVAVWIVSFFSFSLVTGVVALFFGIGTGLLYIYILKADFPRPLVYSHLFSAEPYTWFYNRLILIYQRLGWSILVMAICWYNWGLFNPISAYLGAMSICVFSYYYCTNGLSGPGNDQKVENVASKFSLTKMSVDDVKTVETKDRKRYNCLDARSFLEQLIDFSEPPYNAVHLVYGGTSVGKSHVLTCYCEAAAKIQSRKPIFVVDLTDRSQGAASNRQLSPNFCLTFAQRLLVRKEISDSHPSDSETNETKEFLKTVMKLIQLAGSFLLFYLLPSEAKEFLFEIGRSCLTGTESPTRDLFRSLSLSDLITVMERVSTFPTAWHPLIIVSEFQNFTKRNKGESDPEYLKLEGEIRNRKRQSKHFQMILESSDMWFLRETNFLKKWLGNGVERYRALPLDKSQLQTELVSKNEVDEESFQNIWKVSEGHGQTVSDLVEEYAKHKSIDKKAALQKAIERKIDTARTTVKVVVYGDAGGISAEDRLDFLKKVVKQKYLNTIKEEDKRIGRYFGAQNIFILEDDWKVCPRNALIKEAVRKLVEEVEEQK
eukprot:m.87101 g.87101  ORF g.87101 m.87101 type:complete len:737 (+) comp36528_c1_seq29:71-2281(+)